MKMNTKFIALLFVIFFVSISLVSASDNDNQTLMINENACEELSIDDSSNNELTLDESAEDNYTANTGTFTELQSLIWGSSAGSTIVLDKDYELDSELVRQHIIIDRSLTIDGNGHTLDGKNTKRIFYIEPQATNTVLENINFVNGYHDQAGAAIFWRADNGVLIDCTFTNNVANQNGGAVYWGANNGTAENNVFENNIAGVKKLSSYQSGGAIYWEGNDGNALNNRFLNNFALTNGGAITWKGTNGNMSNNVFLSNLGKESGGAVYWDGNNGFMHNNTFDSNTAELSGGAIYYEAENGVATGNNFIKNIAKTNAGAIRWNGNEGTVNNNYFESNEATLTGGAIYWEGTNGKMNKNSFIKNNANVSAGAVMWNGNFATLDDNTYEDNTASNYGGAVYFKGNSSSLTNSEFRNNKASKSGGAICWEGLSGQVTGNTFENSISNSGSGGAIRWNADNGVVSKNTFKNSQATSGGAIYWDGANGKLTDNTFIKNTATNAGGAVYWNSNNAEIIGNSFDESISTTNYGGAIYFNGASSKINNNNFTNNKASKTGGAIYYNGEGNTASNNIFTSNVAQSGSGGAIRWNGNSATLTGNTFEGNSATNTGNAIYGEGNNGQITKNTFINSEEGKQTLDWRGENNKISDNTYEVSGETVLTMNDLNVYYGTSEKLIATLTTTSSTPLAGKTITISFNGKSYTKTTDSKGQAIIDLSTINAGSYDANANFAGDGRYDASSANAKVIINKAPTKTTINLTKVIYAGDDIIITAYVNATEGNVTFDVGDPDRQPTKQLVNGSATLKIPSGFIAGTYNVTVTYEPGSNYLASYANDQFIVIMRETTLLTSDVTMYVGGKGKVTFTLIGSVDTPLEYRTINIVSIGENLTLLTDENGKVSFELENLELGTYEVTAFYEGIDLLDYNSTATSTITVKSTIESKDLTAEIGNVKYNATFLDSNGNPLSKGEYVTFTVENDVYRAQVGDNGVATATINKGVGTYTIISTNTVTGETATNKLKITKANPNINVMAKDIAEGDDAVFEITANPQATGNVTLTINNNNYQATLEKGKAQITVSNLTGGNYPYTVKYIGDANYTEQTVNGTLNVKSTDIIISAPDVTKYYKGPDRLTVTLTDKSGAPLKDKVVLITINGQTYDRTTNSNGEASMALNLNSGNYTAEILFKGDADYKAVNTTCNVLIKPTVIGQDITKIEKASKPYVATFLDNTGKPLAKGTEIEFNINGVFYKRAIGDNGEGKLNLNLEEGEYTITATNTQTGENTANTVTIKPRIVNNTDLVKYYRNESQYYVTVLDDDGNPVKAGENVTFNVNGVFYTRQTNENGTARMNINLQPNDYIITAEYKKCKVSNNIKVLPVLSAQDITMRYRDGTKFEATLINGAGEPYANQSITFNINGVFYNRLTDGNGTARLNINLMAGEYIITSSYNGANIANKITIKS